MATDVYTGKPITKPSKEHIIPNFLGGRQYCMSIVSEETNRIFADTIETCLSEALHPIRVLVNGLEHRNSSPPRALAYVQGAENRYLLEAGGILRIVPKVELTEENGHLVVNARVPDKDTLERLMRKYAARRGIDLNRLRETIDAAEFEDLPISEELKLSTPIRHKNCYRASAKIACNLFASNYPELFLRPGFDSIRQFVYSGTGPARPQVEPFATTIGNGIGPLDHLAIVKTTHDGFIKASVVYFGSIGFSVLLGKLSPGPQLAMSYRVNQIPLAHTKRRGRRNHPADLKLELASHADLVCRSIEDAETELCRAVWEAFFGAFQVQALHRIQDCLDRALTKFAPDEPLAKEDLRQIRQQISQEISTWDSSLRERAEKFFENLFGRFDT